MPFPVRRTQANPESAGARERVPVLDFAVLGVLSGAGTVARRQSMRRGERLDVGRRAFLMSWCSWCSGVMRGSYLSRLTVA
jgi:hypothetical protein